MKRFGKTLFWSLLAVLSVRLFYKAWIQSGDFLIYWQTSRNWISGIAPPYISYEKLFIIKYPPWTLPLLVPFSVFSFDVSKMIWALIEYLSLIYIIKWVIDQGVEKYTALLVALSMWYIWQSHFYHAQITIILLAIGLWAIKKSSPLYDFILFVTFSTKIFYLVSVAGIIRRFINVKMIFWVTAFMLLSTLTVVWVMNTHDMHQSVYTLVHDWMQSDAATGAELSPQTVRGNMNNGINAGILRWFNVSGFNVRADIYTFIGLTVFLGSIWHHFSKSLNEFEKYTGWIALATIVHPLAWDHSFVLTYPLFAFAVDRAFKSKNPMAITFAFMGLLSIGLFFESIVGDDISGAFENGAIKSWGVIFAAIGLVLARKNQSWIPSPISASTSRY